jgi:3-methylcrotonyl-CoA carboxylase alpha subunit
MDVVSPVAGVILTLEVSSGDRVAEGQTVATLGSMKMEFPIDAPCDGRIDEIVAVEGSEVDIDAVIARITCGP